MTNKTHKLIVLTLLAGLISCGGGNDSAGSAPLDPDTENPASTSPNPNINKGKTVVSNFEVNGTARAYTIYIPESYTGDAAFPLLLSFHGLGGNMQRNYETAKFYELAETENFILVHPNGVNKRWNAVTLSNNKDLNFVNALITSLSEQYNIDNKRVYATGMSNGGYLSFMLACTLSDKITAVASVTGGMFEDTLTNCQPSRPISVMQIHGTADSVVNYESIEPVVNFWVTHNATNTVPERTNFSDVDSSDSSTVQKLHYKNGLNGTEVIHLKVDGGGHSWPGSDQGTANMDIDASKEVWRFLEQFELE